jgi:hypothetical protein
MTGWLKPDGTVLRVPPKHLGVIGNAHHIRFSSTPGESSFFDSCFESEYDNADISFPGVVSWLKALTANICQALIFQQDLYRTIILVID